MAKFEYLKVEINPDVGFFSDGSRKPWIVNNVVVKNWKNGPDEITYLNQLGAEGWELAQYNSQFRDKLYEIYILKRTIAD